MAFVATTIEITDQFRAGFRIGTRDTSGKPFGTTNLRWLLGNRDVNPWRRFAAEELHLCRAKPVIRAFP